tara:strand:+ start:541 stop:2175 length:1635 start_codon:yes stop_codon:yes gene_type:complete
MSLLDPWRQARADIIASRPTYTPFYTPGDYAVTVGNPDTGMVDQVAPEVLPQVVQRQNEVMDDGRTDDMQPLSDPRTVAVEPRPDQKFTGKTADNPYMQIDYRFANPAQPGLLDEPNNPGYGMTYGTGQGPVGDYAQEDLTSYYEPGELRLVPPYYEEPQEEPTTMDIGYTPGGVTYDESGRAYAPALDPRDEPPSVLENLGFIASKDTRGGGRFDVLGQDLLDPEITDARNLRDGASFLAQGLPMGTLFSRMIGTSRAGDLSEVGPYGRDAFNNYRFNASGPMGTLMSPVGKQVTPENYVWGGPMMNDYTGRYGLGTVGNTGISATPAMFNYDGTPKGGAFGYGLGFKSDGTFGSLNAVDVNDQLGIDDQMGRAGFVGNDETGPFGSFDDVSATGTTAMGDTYSASGMTGGIEDYFGDDSGGGGGGDGCVIATHGVKTGGFSERDKAKAEVWCQKKYHGKWWGELFRKGYQYLGNRAIERGKAEKYYGEFKAFIAYGRGLKPGLKHAINYYLRTVQFFTTGAALTGVEQFQKLRKKINDLRNR